MTTIRREIEFEVPDDLIVSDMIGIIVGSDASIEDPGEAQVFSLGFEPGIETLPTSTIFMMAHFIAKDAERQTLQAFEESDDD